MKPSNECAVRNLWRKANNLLKIAQNTKFPKNIARGVSLCYTRSSMFFSAIKHYFYDKIV